jgi:hypothetical protein
MKKLAIASFALLLFGETSQAMLPGMSESGRHIRSLPVIGSQNQDQQFKGAPYYGPMLAPFMPWKQKGPMLAPFMPWRQSAIC